MGGHNTAEQAFSPLAGGYLPQLTDPEAGSLSPTVNGCTAFFGGAAGGWEITLDNIFPDVDIICVAFPAPGSAIPGGVCFGTSQIGPSHFGIKIQKQSDGTTISLPTWFIVFKRPKKK